MIGVFIFSKRIAQYFLRSKFSENYIMVDIEYSKIAFPIMVQED